MKSLAMNKLFSKSSDPDLPNILINIDMLLAEQRHQRNDLKIITKLLNQFINDSKLQSQVDDFYEVEKLSEKDGTSDNNPEDS